MSKKTNSIVFMLLATLLNLVLLVIFFFIGLLLVSLYASAYPESGLTPVLMILVFLLAIGGSFVIYSKLIKWANKKFALEDKLDPLFTPKRHRPREGREE